MPKLESLDIETKVHDLRNTVKVLSCVVGYSLEHPEGPHNGRIIILTSRDTRSTRRCFSPRWIV
jgi:hypothetical protein